MTSPLPFTLSRIGFYEIKAELSSNRRTRLFRASEPSLDNDVVIKVLPPDYCIDPAFRTFFEKTGQTLTLMKHPAIVPIHDVGEMEGYPYIVSRFMPGGSLADLLKKGSLNPGQVFTIIHVLTWALEDAHARGIVHGGIKPSNVLFDENGEPYLADFALASFGSSTAVSLVSDYLGAPAYMSPEQALGMDEVDWRTDIYSLGVLLYEMLTGKLPVIAGSPVEQAANQVRGAETNPISVVPGLAPEYALLIQKAMAKNPDDRYQAAGDLAADLEAVMSGEPMGQYEVDQDAYPAEAEQAAAPQPRHRSGAWLWATAAVLVVLALGLAGLQVSGMFNLLPGIGKTQAPVAEVLPVNTSPVNTSPVNTLPAAATDPAGTQPEVTPALAPTPTLPPTPQPGANPTAAPARPTSTPVPASTEVPALVIGGADKLAFINLNDIWISDLDGENLDRLTNDETPKSELRWTPDGSALVYIQEGCYYMLSYPQGGTRKVSCLQELAFLPDMQNVFLGDLVKVSEETNRWLNFIVPFSSPDEISQIRLRANTTRCPIDGGRFTTFSANGEIMATIIAGTLNGRQAELVMVASIFDPCNLKRLDLFPSTRFNLRGYSGSSNVPELINFGWNGVDLFALNGNVQNGFGDLVIYNMATGRAEPVNPIDEQCCYQDAQFSPDGQYLTFTFRDVRYTNESKIYLIPYGSIGTGQTYTPIDLPYYFFSDARSRAWPALRPHPEEKIGIEEEIAEFQESVPVTIGGADLLAVLNENNIWIANLNGTGLWQLTTDGAQKARLQWTPNGKAILYSQESCWKAVWVDSGLIDDLGCFEDISISHDGSLMVISDLVTMPSENIVRVSYLVPFNLLRLRYITKLEDLESIGGCQIAPGSEYHWSRDNSKFAAIVTVTKEAYLGDDIQVYQSTLCSEQTSTIDTFPGTRFEMRGYSDEGDDHFLFDFAWDGLNLFALHGNIANDYGDLLLYNITTGVANLINPINHQCCYSDIEWGPDWTHMLFAFQSADETELYYLPVESLAEAGLPDPIPFPESFFSKPRQHVHPAVRSASNAELYRLELPPDPADDFNVQPVTYDHPGWVSAVAFSPDGKLMATGSQTTIRLWDTQTGESVKTFTDRIVPHTDRVTSLAFSPDGTEVVSASLDRTIVFWRLSTGNARIAASGHFGPINQVAYSPSGRIVATASNDGTVRLWTVSSAGNWAILNGHTGPVTSVAFSPDGASLASGSADETVIIWDAETGKALMTLAGHTGPVWSVAFSPDGATIASGSWDGTVRLWKTSDGSLLHTLAGHQGGVQSVAFSPDGQIIISAADDSQVWAWQVSSGELQYALEGISAPLINIAVSSDGQLAAGGYDSKVYHWFLMR